MRTSFPARPSRMNRLRKIGSPMFGRSTLALTTAPATIVSAVGTKSNGSSHYIDQITVHGLPDHDSVSLTANVKLRITDGTSNNNKDLTFFVPTDIVNATLSNVPRNFTLRPGGNMVIPAGYRLDALVSSNDVLSVPMVSGGTTIKERAAAEGMPVASDAPLTLTVIDSGTSFTTSATLDGDTNSIAGRIVRVVHDPTTPGIIGQCRTIISNTVTAGKVTSIAIDAAFSTNPAVNAVLEVIGGDAWIGSAIVSDTTAQTIIGSVAPSDAGRGKCIQILGWYVTGLNDSTGADTSDIRLYFRDRTEENTGAPATGNISRTVTRWYMAKGTTVLTTPAGNIQTRNYINEGIDECKITGPLGYGLAIVGSSAAFTGSFSIVVWGRLVNPDQTDQYNPHGTLHGTFAAAATTATGSVTRFLPTNEKGTASAGTASTLVDATKAEAAGPPVTGWKTGIYVGANVTILNGTGAGQTRRITGVTAATGTLTVAPNWGTNPDATSEYVITGFGGEDFWFCFDTEDTEHASAALAALDVQSFFATDRTQPTALAATGDPDVMVEGVVMQGHSNLNAAAVAVVNAALTVASGVTLFLLNGQANVRSYFALEQAGVQITPFGNTAADGHSRTGLGVVGGGAFDAATITIWGRRLTSNDASSSPGIFGT